jgi:hypothetical protein
MAKQMYGTPYSRLSPKRRALVDQRLAAAQTEPQAPGAASPPRPATGEYSGSILGGAQEFFDKPESKRLLNFDKIGGVSDEGKQALADAVLEAAERQKIDPYATEKWSDVEAAAQEMDPEYAQDLVRGMRNLGIKTRAAAQAVREHSNGLADETAKRQLELDTITDPELKAQKARELLVMENDLGQIMGAFAGSPGEAGRNLAVYRLMAGRRFDEVYWLNKAARVLGLQSGADIPLPKRRILSRILSEGREAQKKGDKAGVESSRQKLAQEMAALHEHGWIETMTAWRKGPGLLSGLRTHGTNILNTSLNVFARKPAERGLSSLLDMALSAISQQRTVSGAGYGRGLRRTLQGESRYQRGHDLFAAEGSQGNEQGAGIGWNFQKLGPASRPVNWFINATAGLLAKEDIMLKKPAFELALAQLSRVEALNTARSLRTKGTKMSKADVAAYEKNLYENPTETMLHEAYLQAGVDTFNQENGLSEFVQGGARRLKSWAHKQDAAASEKLPEGSKPVTRNENLANLGLFGASIPLPFARTPSNVFVEYARGPIAPFEMAWGAARWMTRGYSPQIQRDIATAFGRGVPSLGLMLAGYYNAANGNATGMYGEVSGSDKGEAAQDKMTGRRRASVKIGGQWVSIAPAAPLAPTWIMGATLYEMVRNQFGEAAAKDPFKAIALFARDADAALEAGKTTAMAAVDIAKEHPLAQGFKDVSQILESERGLDRAVGDIAGSFVPAALSDIGAGLEAATGGSQRDTRPEGLLDAVKQGVQARTPGWRHSLPPKLSSLGTPIPEPLPIVPLRYAPDLRVSDPVVRELASIGVDVNPPRYQKKEPYKQFAERAESEGLEEGVDLRQLPEETNPDYEKRLSALGLPRQSQSRMENAVMTQVLGHAMSEELRDLFASPEYKASTEVQDKRAMVEEVIREVRRDFNEGVGDPEYQALPEAERLVRLRSLLPAATNAEPSGRSPLYLIQTPDLGVGKTQ